MYPSLLKALQFAKHLGKLGGKSLTGNLRKAGERIVKNIDIKNPMEWGMALGPDLLFGGVEAAMTPGDAMDKTIAGLGSAIGGGGGGLMLRGLTGVRNPLGQLTAEMVGGIGGDMIGRGVADNVLRVKGGGTTPWEKLQAEEYEQLRQQMYQQIMREQGLVA